MELLLLIALAAIVVAMYGALVWYITTRVVAKFIVWVRWFIRRDNDLRL